MILNISHETSYSYDEPVSYTLQQLRLTPKRRAGQQILNWNVEVTGGGIELEFDDQHNNRVLLVKARAGEKTIKIKAHGSVETSDISGVTGKHGGYLPLWYFTRSTPLTTAGNQISELAATFEPMKSSPLDCMHALSEKIADLIAYRTGRTDAETTAEEAMAKGKGVCQDHTHVFLSAARLLGFPARYVSGYLMLNDSIDQEASHAWAEAYIEDLGWIGFDISNRISPDSRYVPIATGLDYLETAPISGMRYGSGNESMIVNLQVQQ
jgi:transglutaminase-like putative cysteine protease